MGVRRVDDVQVAPHERPRGRDEVRLWELAPGMVVGIVVAAGVDGKGCEDKREDRYEPHHSCAGEDRQGGRRARLGSYMRTLEPTAPSLG